MAKCEDGISKLEGLFRKNPAEQNYLEINLNYLLKKQREAEEEKKAREEQMADQYDEEAKTKEEMLKEFCQRHGVKIKKKKLLPDSCNENIMGAEKAFYFYKRRQLFGRKLDYDNKTRTLSIWKRQEGGGQGTETGK